jgi:hypothetical protein
MDDSRPRLWENPPVGKAENENLKKKVIMNQGIIMKCKQKHLLLVVWLSYEENPR